jgi:hypothetical protein
MKDNNKLYVCDMCLIAIESREGSQSTKVYYPDTEDDDDCTCNWCEESNFDKLYELT